MKTVDLGILIVTFHSEKIIENLLNNLKNFNVIVIENSNNEKFKSYLESKFSNVKCILPGSNLGYGAALNIGFNKFKFKNYLILNPDIEISNQKVFEIYNKAESSKNISVVAPSTVNKKGEIYVRHGFFKFKKKKSSEFNDLIKAHYVNGHAFLIKASVIEDVGNFDENFFMNFEEYDLFFRIYKKNYNIYVMKNCFVKHFDGKSSDLKYYPETSITSKWHYSWGFYYFFKKNYGKIIAIFLSFFHMFSCLIKLIYFFIKKENHKKNLMVYSLKGLLESVKNKKSYYRPKI